MTQIEHISFAQSGDTNVHFIPSLFNDTLKLLFEAHNYFDFEGSAEQELLPEAQQLVFANEMSRVTMRLTSVMAWLMIRKALHEGSIDGLEEHIRETYGLEGQEICLVDTHSHHGFLPEYMVYLLEKSLLLYQRVLRMDEQETQPPSWMVHHSEQLSLM